MTVNLLVCQFSPREFSSLKQWCDQQLPVVKVNSMNCVEDLPSYLQRGGKYEDREHPTPHLLLLKVSPDDFPDLQQLLVLKQNGIGRKLPILVVGQGLSQAEVNQLYQYPISAVLVEEHHPDPIEIGNLLRNTLHYWLEVVKLPML